MCPFAQLDVALDHSEDHTQSPRNRQAFLQLFFQLLEAASIRYCVLHGWEGLPSAELASDLDLAMSPGDVGNLGAVLRELSRAGFRAIQFVEYAVRCFCITFAWIEREQVECIAVDVCGEFRAAGVVLSAARLLANRVPYKGLWVAAPDAEFAYLLLKTGADLRRAERHHARLAELSETLGTDRSFAIADEMLPANDASNIFRLCEPNWRHVVELRNPGIWQRVFADAMWTAREIARGFRRLFHPPGLFLVFLGPDGVGKSSIIREMESAFPHTFRFHHICHFRPFVIGGSLPVSASEPHAQPARGRILSLLHLAGFAADYWLGYLLHYFRMLRHCGLLLYDRYFYDVVVDPTRYRYGGPALLARAACHLVPRPSLIILLDAPINILLRRKQEIPEDQIIELRAKYLQIATSLCATVTDASQGVQHTTAAVAEHVIEFMSARFLRTFERRFR